MWGNSLGFFVGLIQQPVFGGEDGGFAAAGETEFVEDAAQVVAGGVLADDQFPRDLFVW